MKITDNYWGKEWRECFPFGNGHLGVMASMNPLQEELFLSENTFFSGELNLDEKIESAPDCFRKMRELVKKGELSKAEEVEEKFLGNMGNYGTNLPVGRLLIGKIWEEKDKIRKYSRELDLNRGVGSASGVFYNGQESFGFELECFASHTENAFLYRIMNTGKIEEYFVRFIPHCQGKVLYEQDSIVFSVSARETVHSDGTNGTRLCGICRIWTDGNIQTQNDSIHIHNCSKITVRIDMITDFGKTETEFQKDTYRIKNLSHNKELQYDRWKEAHVQDFSGYMKRSQIEIEDVEEDGRKFALLYQYGRYLLLSSSREDSLLPAHLQGIWNDNVACRIGWTCDMHLDINTQMNYWPAEPAGLGECSEPLSRWIKDFLLPQGRKTAQNWYGLRGWVAELVSNAWAYAAPYWAISLSPCPTGGIWAAMQIWEHYLFSKDKKFLETTVFPVISEAVDFFLDYVFWDKQEQVYLSGPSISPENSFLDEEGNVHFMDLGCTYEILMIRELYTVFLECLKEMEKKDFREKKVRLQLENLLPYRMNKDGSLREWKEERKEADPQHRHTSHLLGLYPFFQIHPQRTPELAEAAKKTIAKKLSPEDNWEDTGWARSLLALYSARLYDGNEAKRHLKALQRLQAPNHMIMHPPTRGAASFDDVYEIDGNTGFTSAVGEMLLQSEKGNIRILPALPDSWIKGKVSGFYARGGIRTAFSWNGKNITGKVEALRDYQGNLLIGQKKIHLKLNKGDALEFQGTL